MKSQFKKEFAKLLDNTKAPSTLSQEEHIKALRELHDFVQPHIPSKLFRFRKCGIDEMISFEQGTIPMCIADKFSDKYDSNVYCNYKLLSDRFEYFFRLTISNIVQKIRLNSISFPDCPFKTQITDMIENNDSDCEIVNVIRKNFDSVIEKIKTEMKEQEVWPRNNKLTKIGCFTERIDSKIMWDHYADGYKGFALEYDFRKWYVLDANLYPIIYSNQMLDATEMIDRICAFKYINSIQPEEANKKIFELLKGQLLWEYPVDLMYFTKIYLYKDRKEYSYEREWRMLKISIDDNQDYISIPDKGYLRAIYYGLNMEPRYKAHLRTIAKTKGIKEYEVVLNKNSKKYSLSVVPL